MIYNQGIPKIGPMLFTRSEKEEARNPLFLKGEKIYSFAWSKIIWDIAIVAYLTDPYWFRSEIRHTPILTDQYTYSVDNSKPFYRFVTYLERDKIFGDLFMKIQKNKK